MLKKILGTIFLITSVITVILLAIVYFPEESDGMHCVAIKKNGSGIFAYNSFTNTCKESLNVVIFEGVFGKWDSEKKYVSGGEVIHVTSTIEESYVLACVAPKKPRLFPDKHISKFYCK